MSSGRRILISCNLAKFGGCETHVYHLSRFLREHGADVTLAAQTCELNDEWRDDLHARGVQIVTTPFRWDTPFRPARHAWALASFAGRLRRDYDVLVGIAHGGFHRLLTPFVRPGGWSIYNLVTAALGLSRATLFAMRGMQSVITMSSHISPVLRAQYGIRKPMGALPHLNGPIDEAAASAPRPPLAPDGEVRIAFFGRLSALKRPDLLLRHWRGLDLGKARYDIHGDGEKREEMRRFVQEHNLGEQVAIHGPYEQRDALSLMREAHLIILPSIGLEGLPQVLIEALACGVPILATNVGGMPELANGSPDVSICGTSEDEVTSALQEMVRRLRCGEISASRIRAHYRAKYAFEEVAARWRAALYDPDRFFYTDDT